MKYRLLTSLAAFGVAAFGVVLAAPAPQIQEDKAPDRAGYIPKAKYQQVPSRVVGVLVSDVVKVMGNEGRSGPPDAMAFSSGGGSYRWAYVPAINGMPAIIQNLQVKIGAQGDQTRIYPALNMANPTTVKELWGIKGPYALVEVEVNDKLGAPADESFVATKMTQIDGTRDYPIRATEAVEQGQKRYGQWRTMQQGAIDGGLLKAQKDALGDQAATGPRETNEMVHISWLPDVERLRVRFLTKITDGAYQLGGGADLEARPVPLPVLPIKGGIRQRPQPAPPQRFEGFRSGTQFGIEFGVSYEFDKTGNLAKIQTLPIESFRNMLPPIPGAGGPGRFPLPPQPIDR